MAANCESNVNLGKSAVMLVRNEADTDWLIAGGVKTKTLTKDSPVEDTTSQSTTGNYTESEHTGYSTLTMSISGAFDTRSTESRTIDGTSYDISDSKLIEKIAYSETPAWKIKLIYPNRDIEGCFNFTNFEITGETPGLMNFSANLQSKSTPTITEK